MSKDLNQLDFLEKPAQSQAPHREAVSVETIRRRPTLLRAWHLAQEISGLEDKQVYSRLDIDASHWTRIKNGSASPPADERFVKFMDVVQNEVPLIWLVEARGYDWSTLRKHRSQLEQENEALRAELADHKRALSLVLTFQKGKSHT